MKSITIGLLHPGEMGVTVGAAALTNVDRVLWASQGRSSASRRRAQGAGLEDVQSLASLATQSDSIISVCPPDRAEELAACIVELGFDGLYVDANAISPETTRRIAARFASGSADFVDGGLIGPPAIRAGHTRLHLAGERAREVAEYFASGSLEACVIPGPVGAASALKMVFAAQTKGSMALLAATYAVACAEGVGSELIAEWEKLLPDLLGRLRSGVPITAQKAWRFSGEMREIAATFESAGLPDGFHLAAAEIYRRLEGYKDASEPPDLDAWVGSLLGERSGIG
jgi:3-hydroxyisobutyrate dehydrogenase-like beta-hydroxyacid dehydrogenase